MLQPMTAGVHVAWLMPPSLKALGCVAVHVTMSLATAICAKTLPQRARVRRPLIISTCSTQDEEGAQLTYSRYILAFATCLKTLALLRLEATGHGFFLRAASLCATSTATGGQFALLEARERGLRRVGETMRCCRFARCHPLSLAPCRRCARTCCEKLPPAFALSPAGVKAAPPCAAAAKRSRCLCHLQRSPGCIRVTGG